MEAISLKLDEGLLHEMEQAMKKHRYSTKTEFIRDAIRKRLSDFEKQEMLKALSRLHGSSKRKTTDAQIKAARAKAFEELGKGVKIRFEDFLD